MEELFELEINQELGTRWKKTLLTILGIIGFFGIIAFGITVIIKEESAIGTLIGTIIILSSLIFAGGIVTLEEMISDKFDKKIEEEKKKKVTEKFILYKGIKEKEVYKALKSIVFSEKRPTQKEIQKINEITNIFNQLKEETVIQKTESYEEKVNQYIKNLKDRKYLKATELDEKFEEKHKQKLEEVIVTYKLQLNEEPTDENIEKMFKKCEKRINVQKKLGISNHALEDITNHLQKINGNAQKIREEEIKTTSSVVNEIIKIAQEEEEVMKMKIEAELEDRLSVM